MFFVTFVDGALHVGLRLEIRFLGHFFVFGWQYRHGLDDWRGKCTGSLEL